MPKDVHAIELSAAGEIYILLFDESNRSEMRDWIECWSIDPAYSLSMNAAQSLLRAIDNAPELPEHDCAPLRGGLGALDSV